MQSARAAADSLGSTSEMPRGSRLEFDRIEDRGAEILVHYKRVYESPTLVNPSEATIAYDRETGKVRWLNRE